MVSNGPEPRVQNVGGDSRLKGESTAKGAPFSSVSRKQNREYDAFHMPSPQVSNTGGDSTPFKATTRLAEQHRLDSHRKNPPSSFNGAGESVQAHKEADFCKFESSSRIHNYRSWFLSVKKEVARVSGKPKEGYQWMAEVESTTSLDHASDPKRKNPLA